MLHRLEIVYFAVVLAAMYCVYVRNFFKLMFRRYETDCSVQRRCLEESKERAAGENFHGVFQSSQILFSKTIMF